MATSATFRSSAGLPLPRTPLVGRDRELTELRALLLRPEVPLVTLTGPGGVGKTRLALQAAAEAGPAFADGVAFVSLTSIVDPELVLPGIARALGLQDTGDRPLPERLALVLRNRELLLLLDNFEQAIEAAPALNELLVACPALTAMTTSREPLRVRGEHEFLVHPLALPRPGRATSAAELERLGAIALFVQRARAVRPAFALSDQNASEVTGICARLDGLPLAIELAAARLNVLDLGALQERMDRPLRLLVHGARDLPQRQQTMRNAVAWSYDLLSSVEQALFRRLAVFVGGFGLEAAEEVTRAGSELGIDLLAGVTSLVEKNLLRQEVRDGSARFSMLETIREFGLDGLEQEDEAERTRWRLALWIRAFTEKAGRQVMGRVDPVWLARIHLEIDNVRVVLGWALDRHQADLALKIAYAVGWYWYVRGQLSEGRVWMDRALACPGETTPAARLAALLMAAWYAAEHGDFALGDRLIKAALPLAREANVPFFAAQALMVSGMVDIGLNAFESARVSMEAALAVFRDSRDDADWSSLALKNLGFIAYRQGNGVRAQALLEQALQGCRERGYAYGIGITLINMAKMARDRHALDRAAELYAEALALRHDHDDKVTTASCLRGLALVAAESQKYEEAVRLLGADAALRLAIGASDPRSRSHVIALDAARTALGDTAFERAWSEGRLLEVADAVLEALAFAEGRATPVISEFGLTPREREILAMLAAGRSNPEIADALFISRRTVTTHLTHLFTKLDVANRAEATALAHRRGLLPAASRDA